jgi:hypothetical protein
VTSDAPNHASAHDIEHFRKIGRRKYESHQDALRRHLELPIEERFVASLPWGMRERVDWKWDTNRDGPGPRYERARQLGLYGG